MSKAKRNRRIRDLARSINPEGVSRIARRIRKNRNPSKYDVTKELDR